ncbi:ribbon-helix-helix domain-containing protein [Mesorhizobium sp.]|uniref:ribbon-helix-helix domain-containing protein n=1 Tax=Mesorhizobium sp. TaxID=1871066 RepID=UPI00121DA957|nr:ribbon-helix-helix domain-containing protein [Mesorhizobium sp.]TIP14319.1 MAG: hypothetical protein E5X73_05400 [Mesorhizobium sp.]
MRDRITVRMTTGMLQLIDEWIAQQPGYVSRQEVVRRCVDAATVGRKLAISNKPDGQTIPTGPPDAEVLYLES